MVLVPSLGISLFNTSIALATDIEKWVLVPSLGISLFNEKNKQQGS